MTFFESLIPISFAGSHTAITLLALYRARKALWTSAAKGRADRGTPLRLAFLRLVAVLVAFSGAVLALATPLVIVASSRLIVMPTTAAGMAAVLGAAWLVWIPATIALDNLALRWLKRGFVRG